MTWIGSWQAFPQNTLSEQWAWRQASDLALDCLSNRNRPRDCDSPGFLYDHFTGLHHDLPKEVLNTRVCMLLAGMHRHITSLRVTKRRSKSPSTDALCGINKPHVLHLRGWQSCPWECSFLDYNQPMIQDRLLVTPKKSDTLWCCRKRIALMSDRPLWPAFPNRTMSK